MENHLSYYISQSATSMLGKYAELFSDLPRDIPDLAQVIHGLMMHDNTLPLHGLALTPERRKEINLRTIPDRLARILEFNSSPLTVTRVPVERVTGTCRDFALLFASMARYQGIPVRIRTGYAPYLPGLLIGSHYLPEYWDVKQQRWILLDPQIDEITCQANDQITFDPLDIVFDQDFYLSGTVWQWCRSDEANPLDFGDATDDRGWPHIRYGVIQELERLNKVELLGWDDWSHHLLTKPEADLTETERIFIDRIAKLTIDADQHFDELQSVYKAMPDYQQTREKMQEMGLFS